MKHLLLFFLLTLSCTAQFRTETRTAILITSDADSIKIVDVKAGTVVTCVIVYADTLLENLNTFTVMQSQSNDELLSWPYDVELTAIGQAKTSRPDTPVGMADDYIMLHWSNTGSPVTGRVKVYIETILLN